MSPGWRISPALLAAVAAAAVSFGVCFAVVADATRTVAPVRSAETPRHQPIKANLELKSAPSLRVRAGVLPAPAPPRRAVTAASEPPTREQEPPPEETQQEPTTTTEQQPEPVQKPKPAPKKKPKPQPSGPDFDDSGPQGPSSSGG